MTGNKNKFEEIKLLLPEIEHLDVDLPEIQALDAKHIITTKLLEALTRTKGEFIVEDTSLYLECLQGLPGPLIKWFLETLGPQGLVQLTEKLGTDKAEAKTLIGYARSAKEMYYFEGSIKGRIVQPRGTRFGWDPIFQPEGQHKTFAEMSKEEKNTMSHRRRALDKLKEFLHKS
ncbi:non-canonical purine NTP pyrophosphatase [Candidatus Woesearchaeota archaeon]|nr:non-canonical purine NTP pyrophosphatase [Candidatus Woesearchaeota archaeon]